jgi:hypothetical protein
VLTQVRRQKSLQIRGADEVDENEVTTDLATVVRDVNTDEMAWPIVTADLASRDRHYCGFGERNVQIGILNKSFEPACPLAVIEGLPHLEDDLLFVSSTRLAVLKMSRVRYSV